MNNETLADIVAEMRQHIQAARDYPQDIDITDGDVEDWADRTEAAAKREQAVDEDTSDGYHTFKELYRYRMLYNAAFFNMLARHTDIPVVKFHRHGDGEPCFGGGWFIVSAHLPTGQVSNHYEDRFWGLFCVPEAETAPEWDGHTPNDAADRLESFLKMREPDSNKPKPSGNAAAMRKAIEEQLRYWDTHVRTRDEEAMRQRIECALSAPARNCDVGTAQNQHERWKAFCAENYNVAYAESGLNPCDDCPLVDCDANGNSSGCEFAWAQMPYEAEGGAE